MSFTSLKIFSFVGKSIQDFKNHAGFQVKFHHAWIKKKSTQYIWISRDHSTNKQSWTYLWLCVFAFSILQSILHLFIVFGIYMNMLFVFQQNNIYCICSVFAYIFSDNEFVRFYRVRKIYVQLIKPWMTLICAGTLYLLLIWCQTFSVQT